MGFFWIAFVPTVGAFALHPLFGIGTAFFFIFLWHWRNRADEAARKVAKEERRKKDDARAVERARAQLQVLNRAAAQGISIALHDDGHPMAFESKFDAENYSNGFTLEIRGVRKTLASSDAHVLKQDDCYFVVLGGQDNDALRREVLSNYFNPSLYEDEESIRLSESVGTKRTISTGRVLESRSSKYHYEYAKQEAKKAKMEEARLKALSIKTRSKADAGSNATALYTMSSQAGLKVGISSAPARRLSQLRTTHPGDLTLTRSWWLGSREDAATLEREVHLALKKDGWHLNREWFSVSQSQAETVIDSLIDRLFGTA